MNEKHLREFLGYNETGDIISENKLWIWLYSIITILFIDIHFFVTVDLENNILWFIVNIFLTLLIIPFVIICIKIKQKSISQMFFSKEL